MKLENNIAVKKNNSSMQVLKTLQVLLQGNYTMAELIEKLNEKEEEPVFNNSVVSKYINTCRYCGINILKIQNRYYVANIPFGMNLTDSDCKLLQMLELTAQNALSPKDANILSRVIRTISSYSNKEIVRVQEKTINLTLRAFENAIKSCKKIKLIHRNKSETVCIPLEKEMRNKKIYLRVYADNREKSYLLDRLDGLEVINEKFTAIEPKRTIIYRLYGGLSKRYQIREHEEIFNDSSPDSVVIINKGEDMDSLLSRLLRYDSLCEITKPKEYRDEMIKIIDETLANYGVTKNASCD